MNRAKVDAASDVVFQGASGGCAVPPSALQAASYCDGQGQPISVQPMSSGIGTPGLTAPPNVTPGLEYLTHVNHLVLEQTAELLEVCCGCESKNNYKVKDGQGTHFYNAKEDTGCCNRHCCGSIRSFDIKIKDMSDQDVIRLYRPLACGSCLFPCCLQSLEVYAPPNQLAGTVEQEWSLCTPQFVVKDPYGNSVLKIEGTCCTCKLCGSVEFRVLSRDGSTQVGKISKKWSGLLTEAFSDADNFGISFPVDMDVRMKAVMLGAAFLIDFMFFEHSP